MILSDNARIVVRLSSQSPTELERESTLLHCTLWHVGQLLDLGSLRAKSIETAKNKIYTKSTHNLHLECAYKPAGWLGTPVDNLEHQWPVQVGLTAPDGVTTTRRNAIRH